MKSNYLQTLRSLSVLVGTGAFALAVIAADNKPEGGKPSVPASSDKVWSFADFESGKTTTLVDTSWQVFTDETVGGKSSAQISIVPLGAGGSKGAMRLSGKLTPDFQWGGFVGARASLQKGDSPKDMSAFTGVQFYARGDGKKYRVLLSKENVRDGNHFYMEFTAGPEWTLIRAPFSKLGQSPYFGTQVSWSADNLKGLGFLAMGEQGATADVALEVDNISFYSQP
jgi:hypothetical protein